jgi:hypothetical protein
LHGELRYFLSCARDLRRFKGAKEGSGELRRSACASDERIFPDLCTVLNWIPPRVWASWSANSPVTISSDQPSSLDRGLISSLRSSMPRSEFFAALCIVGCANGIISRVMQAIARHGWVEAVLSTFEVSVIVWIAGVIGIRLVLEDRGDRIGATDLAVGVMFLLLAVLPGGGGSWLALTALSLYMLQHSAASSSRRRGAMILLALTVPMLWSPLLFRCFSETILGIDASLVSRMLGTTQDGNMVRFADGSGDLVIFPACSSIANLSLVFVCWVTMSQAVGHRWTSRDLIWCFLAGASVVATNVTRISLMGLSEWHYHTVHSGLGDLTTNVIALCLMVGFCVLGLRRDLFPRL